MKQIEFKEIQKQIDQWIRPDYIKPEDIPSIELYMDQITTFMEQQLGGNKRHSEDKVLTKTMINNYSKNNLLPPSDKKRYSKDHIILLIYIYYLKNFLSINDIQSLLQPVCDAHFQSEHSLSMEEIYKQLFALEKEYGIKVRENINEIYNMAQTQFDEKNDYLKTFAMIAMLSYDIYAKKQLIERLIDAMADDVEAKKDARENLKQKEKAEKESSKARAKVIKQQEKRTKKGSKPQ